MCGITGFTYRNEKIIRDCLNMIAHRGPDSSGVYIDDNVSFGHVRLSILDLSDSASQPMISEDGSVVIVFNGEIYNFKDIRMSLEKKGHVFRSSGDTEVVLKGYKEYGKNIFGMLRGMWACAIYDKKLKKIIISRDFFGIKPLYYCILDKKFYFASEIKCLKKILPMTALNKEFYYQFFNLGYFCSPSTYLKGVNKLVPGEILEWDISKKTASLENLNKKIIYDPVLLENQSFDDAVDFVHRKIKDSLEAHYISDVPVGLLLSGGNDSSLLASLSNAVGKKPEAFHVSIEGSSDTYYAKEVARHLGIKLEIFSLKKSFFKDQYQKLWSFLDEPLADTSIIPTSLVYSKIKGHTKVVLSGEGGDELFGGYLRHSSLLGADKVCFENSPLDLLYGSNRFSLNFINPMIGKIKDLEIRHGINRNLINTYLRKTKVLDFPVNSADIKKYLLEFYNSNNFKYVIDKTLFFDLFLYLPNNLMYKNDISSMASSIEARVPFLDKDFFNSIFSGVNHKYIFSKNYQNKAILKAILEKYIPKELVYRDKKGFGVNFDFYNSKYLINDFEMAIDFHKNNLDIFGLDGSFNKLFSKENSSILLKKYPRFAFALISNFKIISN